MVYKSKRTKIIAIKIIYYLIPFLILAFLYRYPFSEKVLVFIPAFIIAINLQHYIILLINLLKKKIKLSYGIKITLAFFILFILSTIFFFYISLHYTGDSDANSEQISATIQSSLGCAFCFYFYPIAMTFVCEHISKTERNGLIASFLLSVIAAIFLK